ncbi:hypothetical protein IWQ60_010325 [Tieghemiomyces parasiticus]|uniref:Uncharacterized protein n=1 Tax=Tieghemiomyces parasiticus TaxID=78921 RepID=A0A9W7ZLF2_9FUNG|nr:hypothetical protein IWQ60_010325 [Tieghemiomyces parasiticus]
MEGTPTAKAYTWANIAEDYSHRGRLAEAIKAHLKAGEMFKEAQTHTHDVESAEALELLSQHHQQEAARLRVELASRSPGSSRISSSGRRELTGGDEEPLCGPAESNSDSAGGSGGDTTDDCASETSDSSASSASSQTTSQRATGQSADPAETFWDFIENFVDKISGPIPAGGTPGAPSPHTPTVITHCARHAQQRAPPANLGRSVLPSMAESYYVVPEQHRLAESTALIENLHLTSNRSPPSDPATPATTDLAAENDKLKRTVVVLQKQVSLLEKVAMENTMLRSSIYSFQQEVHKKARDYKLASSEIRPPGIATTTTPTTGEAGNSDGIRSGISAAAVAKKDGHEACERRVAQLEAELVRTRAIAKKQDEMLAKYKDRWDKLKESAKLKRNNRRDSAPPS